MSASITESKNEKLTWQQEMSHAFTDIDALCNYLDLCRQDLPTSYQAADHFPLRVPICFASRMKKGNPEDPLLKQVLPVNSETISYPGFTRDPVGDLDSAPVPGILHKYSGRVLLINTGSCAINCRYCFRRNFPYADHQLSRQKENAALQYIDNDKSISEVILSGGDPLLLNDARLESLICKLDDIEHLRRIRIHTRIPVVLPNRITPDLLHALTSTGKQTVLVTHVNHGNEIDTAVIEACNRLKEKSVTLLNQSVLLNGINDNSEAQCHLSEQLFSAGILPYYLHLLDKAVGTGHFAVDESRAIDIIDNIRTRLPGYLVPKLVREVAGMHSKQPLPAAAHDQPFSSDHTPGPKHSNL